MNVVENFEVLDWLRTCPECQRRWAMRFDRTQEHDAGVVETYTCRHCSHEVEIFHRRDDYIL